MPRFFGLLVVVALGIAGIGLIANDQAGSPAVLKVPDSQVQKVPPTPPATLVVTPEENDRRIARWLVVDNEAMMAVCKLAMDQAADGKVKELARSIADAHQKIHHNLKLIISPRTEPSVVEPGSRPVSKTEVVAPASPLVTVKVDAGELKAKFTPTDFITVKERVCSGLRTKLEQELKGLTGPQFDKAFLGQLTLGHEALLATLEALKDHRTNELRNTLEDFRQTTEKHLKQVRDLRQ